MLTKAEKRKWLRALRSGKYKQTEGGLHCSNGYCCLGVLCDVIDNSKWKEDTNKFDGFKYGRSAAYLPKSIKLSRKIQYKLAELNDVEGYNFKEIADYISKNVKTSD